MQEHTRKVSLSIDDIKDLNTAILRLNAVIKNSQLYPPEHPQIRESAVGLLQLLQKQLGKHGNIALKFMENQVVFHNTFLCEITGAVSGLVNECLTRHFQSIVFSKGLELDDIVQFAGIMSMSPEELEEKSGIQQEMFSRRISHISIESLGGQEKTTGASGSKVVEALNAKEIYRKAYQEVKKSMEDIESGETITNVENIKELVNGMTHSLLSGKSMLLGLTSIKSYDEYTFYHSVNVGILSLSLGIHLSLPKDSLQCLGIGGILHDIGKIRIPKSILNKPGKLSEDEWSEMQKHPVNGARLLRKTSGLPEHASVVAFEHHVKYDLSGYPSLIRKRPLSPYSMVAGIADCYDAMTTLRPYQKPRTPAEALKIMLGLSGRDFEPVLIREFITMMGPYPVGSLVRLDTNEFAVVYELNPEDSERPIVKLVKDDVDRSMSSFELVDLKEKNTNTGVYRRSIIHAVEPASKGVNIANFF